MTIYLDLVFLMNFFGDFLCLCLTSGIYRRTPLWRRALAAAIGGIYGAAAVLPGLGFLGSLPVKAVAGVMIANAAYLPAGLVETARAACVFVISSMLLCGGAELFLKYDGQPALVLTLLGIACLLWCALAALRSRIYARHMSCVLCFKKKKVRTYGFYDSGNRLIAGENGSRVIVADSSMLAKLLGEGAALTNMTEWVNEDEILHIPFGGAAGGVLLGLRLDYATVGGRRYDDVILGITPNRMEEKLVLHSTMV